jgi:hypothetical protein
MLCEDKCRGWGSVVASQGRPKNTCKSGKLEKARKYSSLEP